MSTFTKIPRRYMMATEAHHKLGDISSDFPDLCIIYGEDSDNWFGSWVTGFGFVDVRFPKKKTRDLTEEEIARYNKLSVRISNQPAMKLKVD